MSDSKIEQVWKLLDKNRSRFKGLETIFEVAKESNIDLSIEDLGQLTKRLRPSDSERVCPDLVVNFIKQYLLDIDIKSVLDPWAGFGSVIIPLANVLKLEKAVGIEPNSLNIEIAQHLDPKNVIQWIHGDPLTQLHQIGDRFDAVISNTPINIKPNETTLNIDGQEIFLQDNPERFVILKASSLLNQNGIGIFVVGSGFAFQKGQKVSVLNSLNRFGLSIEALLQIPPGTFAPLTNMALNLVIIRRGSFKEVFVGQISDNPERNLFLIKNLKSKNKGEDVSLGRMVKLNDFNGFQSLVAKEKLHFLSMRMGLEPVPINEIVLEINTIRAKGDDEFESKANCIFLPRRGRSKAVTSEDEFSVQASNYIQLVINPEKTNPQYLAGFFNSLIGYMVRDSASFGSTFSLISPSSLLKTSVYLPSLEIQSKVVQTSLKVQTLQSELEELNDKIWASPLKITQIETEVSKINKEERFENWLDTLPFPLASILWAYHASDTDRRKYDYLIHFFEALAQFMATLLLSGYQTNSTLFNEEKKKFLSNLSRNNLSIQSGTFGTWVNIAGYLSKQARIMLNDKEEGRPSCIRLFKVSDLDVLETLLSSAIISVLNDTNQLRNDWLGHGGVISDRVAEQRHLILKTYLGKIRDTFGTVWNRYQLIKPTERMEMIDGVYHVGVKRLMGRSTPFESVELQLNHALEKKHLYFCGQDERESLKLIPFIKIIQSPQTAQNACYFYNRLEGDVIRYVSHHFEEESEVKNSFVDTRKALESLLKIEPEFS